MQKESIESKTQVIPKQMDTSRHISKTVILIARSIISPANRAGRGKGGMRQHATASPVWECPTASHQHCCGYHGCCEGLALAMALLSGWCHQLSAVCHHPSPLILIGLACCACDKHLIIIIAITVCCWWSLSIIINLEGLGMRSLETNFTKTNLALLFMQISIIFDSSKSSTQARVKQRTINPVPGECLARLAM